MIEVKELSKSFAANDGTVKNVLHHMNVTIQDNQFVCLLGPSGCGKSTFLRLLAGLDSPTEGQVLVDGHPVREPPQQSAFVFQNYALFPWMTVLENVAFGMKISGDYTTEARKTRAEKYLAQVYLQGYERHYIHQLSGGMKQRVAIARALAAGPRILFMDEPFGALDTFTRMDLQNLLKELCKSRKLTVLFVTHDIDEAIYLADTVAVMNTQDKGIGEFFPIDIPGERDRTSSVFNEYRKKIFAAFHVHSPEEQAFHRGLYVI